MSDPTFLGDFRAFGRPVSEVLGDFGTALGLVKTARGLTAEDMRKVFGLKGDDQVYKYLAGDAEPGIIGFMLAVEAWPELIERLNETATERAARGRQIKLDLKARAS